MDMIPKMRTRFLTETLGIPVEKELKQKYAALKEKHGVDMLEWTRALIRKEIKILEDQINKKTS